MEGLNLQEKIEYLKRLKLIVDDTVMCVDIECGSSKDCIIAVYDCQTAIRELNKEFGVADDENDDDESGDY